MLLSVNALSLFAGIFHIKSHKTQSHGRSVQRAIAIPMLLVATLLGTPPAGKVAMV